MEDFAFGQFIPHFGVEFLNLAVFPRRRRLDECGLRADDLYPCPYVLGHRFRAVVTSNECERTVQDEQVRQSVDHIRRVQLPLHSDLEALPTELIQDIRRAKCLAVVGSAVNEIIRLDMIAGLGS